MNAIEWQKNSTLGFSTLKFTKESPSFLDSFWIKQRLILKLDTFYQSSLIYSKDSFKNKLSRAPLASIFQSLFNTSEQGSHYFKGPSVPSCQFWLTGSSSTCWAIRVSLKLPLLCSLTYLIFKVNPDLGSFLSVSFPFTTIKTWQKPEVPCTNAPPPLLI